MSIQQQRLDDLVQQFANATVELIDEKERLYRVTVPGAVREENYVKADSDQEAKDKTWAVLTMKTENAPETSTGEVVIKPTSVGGAA